MQRDVGSINLMHQKHEKKYGSILARWLFLSTRPWVETILVPIELNSECDLRDVEWDWKPRAVALARQARRLPYFVVPMTRNV